MDTVVGPDFDVRMRRAEQVNGRETRTVHLLVRFRPHVAGVSEEVLRPLGKLPAKQRKHELVDGVVADRLEGAAVKRPHGAPLICMRVGKDQRERRRLKCAHG
eukprot:scaffold17550_cov119-Isochrysis_galbana.AAC.6